MSQNWGVQWYVQRNGETVGPVDASVVATWVRGGMRDAFVREEGNPNWRALAASPFRPPTKGLGCGFWLIILALCGATIGACYVIPEIGWTGWVIIAAAWWIGGHLNRQNALLAEIANNQRRP